MTPLATTDDSANYIMREGEKNKLWILLYFIYLQ